MAAPAAGLGADVLDEGLEAFEVGLDAVVDDAERLPRLLGETFGLDLHAEIDAGAAAIFAFAATPTFVFLKERARPHRELEHPWRRVKQTLRQARNYRDLWRFLTCILFYQAGIQAVIALAAIYATEAMKFTFVDTIKLILVVNITAAIGAFCFGYLQDAIGHVKAMTLVLIGWIVMIALAYFAQGVALFWVAANLAGLCMGASQAAGRAIVGYLSPPERNAESSVSGAWRSRPPPSSALSPTAPSPGSSKATIASAFSPLAFTSSLG